MRKIWSKFNFEKKKKIPKCFEINFLKVLRKKKIWNQNFGKTKASHYIIN